MNSMADPQRIHPVDAEAPRPSTPLVPHGSSRSDKGEPAGHNPPFRRTIPIAHLRPPKRRTNGQYCYKCFCCTLLTLILLTILLAATLGILYLILHPKIPTYSVDRLSVSAFSIDAALTAHVRFDVTVTTRNPNDKVGIYYEHGSRLSVWYEDTNLCKGSLPEFYQGHRNTTVVAVALTGENRVGSGLVTALMRQQQTGSVPLGFRGDVPVRLKLGGVKLWRMTFGVWCDLVVDSLTASSLISIRASSCKFKKLKIF